MLEHKTIQVILLLLLLGVVGYVLFMLTAYTDESLFSFLHKETPSKMVQDTAIERRNLYREQQEIVTIDLEEHEEPVYVTTEDLRTWHRMVKNEIDEHKQQKAEKDGD